MTVANNTMIECMTTGFHTCFVIKHLKAKILSNEVHGLISQFEAFDVKKFENHCVRGPPYMRLVRAHRTGLTLLYHGWVLQAD